MFVHLLVTFETQSFYDGGRHIRLLIVSYNCGNELISDWTQLVPTNGGNFDLIAIGLQESLFKIKKKKGKKNKKGSGEEEHHLEEDSLSETFEQTWFF